MPWTPLPTGTRVATPYSSCHVGLTRSLLPRLSPSVGSRHPHFPAESPMTSLHRRPPPLALLTGPCLLTGGTLLLSETSGVAVAANHPTKKGNVDTCSLGSEGLTRQCVPAALKMLTVGPDSILLFTRVRGGRGRGDCAREEEGKEREGEEREGRRRGEGGGGKKGRRRGGWGEGGERQRGGKERDGSE